MNNFINNSEPITAAFELPPYLAQRMIELSAAEYGREQAYQEAISKTYTVKALAEKMNVHTETVYNWIKQNRIRYTPVGKKGYCISELARREFMGDVKK